MATVKVAYGAETALTWAGAIASSATAGRQSDAIDNGTTLADDYEVAIKIVFPNSATANDKTVYVYAGGYIGATNTYQGRPALTGSDAAYTFNDITTTPSGLFLAGAFFMVINTTGTFLIPSIATVFGGTVPEKFGLALANYSGQTITTFTATYRAITYTIA